MKFKGFWKALWKVEVETFKFIREWWLPYTLFVVLATIIGTAITWISYFGLPKFNKKTEETEETEDEELDEFFKG